jgi:hypothetical protein
MHSIREYRIACSEYGYKIQLNKNIIMEFNIKTQ